MDYKNIFEKVTQVSKWFTNKVWYLSIMNKIKSAEIISIIWHDRIDWDSLWSVLAMQEWIRNKFPEKTVKSYTNRKYPSVFEFLEPDINYEEWVKIDENTDLIIVMDSANYDRLWELYNNNKEIFEKSFVINIDHHISNTKFWKINIVEPNSPATAQIIYKILKVLDIHPSAKVNTLKKWINDKVALYLLMWILTDTQNFIIDRADDKTLQIASELIKLWANKQVLIDNIFLSKSENELKLQWLILDRISSLEKDWIKTYWSYYTDKDIEKLWLNSEDLWIWRSLSSILVQIKDADFISLWKIKEKETSISFRSKEFDVNKLASKLWWWWHRKAAWAKLDKKILPKDIKKQLEKIIGDKA